MLGKSGQTYDCILIHELWIMICLDGEGPGRDMIEKLWQGGLGKMYMDMLLSMGKKICEGIYVPYECSPKVSLTEDNMICSVSTRQSLSLHTLSSPNELMNKVAVVEGMEVMHEFSSMDFYSPWPPWPQPLLSD